MLDFSDFDTNGFKVVRNWITESDANFIASDYYTSEENDNKNQKTHVASNEVIELLSEKINQVLDAINEQTSLNVDLLTPEAVYFSNQYMRPGWHQDHESFYILQQHTNYLNFYIIVEKDEPLTSGISLISLDTVRDKLKLFSKLIIGGGATTYHQGEQITRATNDDTGAEYIIPLRLDAIATSPELHAGDLLLMRGDIIHKTQDGDSNRLALSVRCTNGAAPIFKSKILKGCDAKKDIIAKHPRGFNYVLNKIGDKESITAFELYGKPE
jgi:hypothetical protein